jgi:hypothetical protein
MKFFNGKQLGKIGSEGGGQIDLKRAKGDNVFVFFDVSDPDSVNFYKSGYRLRNF